MNAETFPSAAREPPAHTGDTKRLLLAARPRALTVLAFGFIAVGSLLALGAVGVLGLAVWLTIPGSFLGVLSGALIAVLASVLSLVASFPLASGIGILHAKRWSRSLAQVTCSLAILQGLGTLAANLGSSTIPISAKIVLVVVVGCIGALAGLGLVILKSPPVQAWYAKATPPRQMPISPRPVPPPVQHIGAPHPIQSFAVPPPPPQPMVAPVQPIVAQDASPRVNRFALCAMLAVGALVAGLIAGLPLSSLKTSADGATLTRDATLGIELSAIMAGIGALLFVRAAKEESIWIPWLSGISAGLVGTVLLVFAARNLSHASLLNGRAQESGPLALTWLALGAGIIVLVLIVATSQNPERAAYRWGGATLIALASAGILFGIYILIDAQPLREAAQARSRHTTPGPEIVLLLLGAAAIALARRRRKVIP